MNVEDFKGCNAEVRRKNNGEGFSLIMLDMRFLFSDVIDILQVVKERNPENDVMIVTGRGDWEKVVEVIRQVAKDVEVRPVVEAYEGSNLGTLSGHHHGPSHVLAERLDRYLEQHFHQESLRLRDVCVNFRISSSYVTRLFREHVGMSFRKRLNLHRVQKAKYLLRTTDHTVDCIARDCGFRNYSRLTEAFYRFEGMSPGRFRRAKIL